METCADLMSRYTYGNSAPYAQQSATVARLLKVKTIVFFLFCFLTSKLGPGLVWARGGSRRHLVHVSGT